MRKFFANIRGINILPA